MALLLISSNIEGLFLLALFPKLIAISYNRLGSAVGLTVSATLSYISMGAEIGFFIISFLLFIIKFILTFYDKKQYIL